MKYRLIALDLDGTLTNADGVVPDDTRAAVRRAIDAGMIVTLATGRMYLPSARFASELGINHPIICYQGALVAEPASPRVLWHKPLPLDTACGAVRETSSQDVETLVYIDDEIYARGPSERVQRYAQRNWVKLNRVDDLVACMGKAPTKISLWGEAPQVEQAAARLKADFGPALLVTKTFPTFCELGHPESGKGNALKRLAGLLGIGQDQTVAVGNGPNDIDMLEWAGLSIAVAGSPPEVIAAADWVIDPQSEEGLVQVMDRLVLMGG